MRKNIFVVGLVYVLYVQSTIAQSKIEFENAAHDFGQIVEGSIAKHDFVFTNTGNQPLVITDVRASCGCTTPTWTSDPVMPGQKGKISAGYNSQGRPGTFHKSIVIISNSSNQYVQLFIKGEVKRNDNGAISSGQINHSPKISLSISSVSLGKVEVGQKIPVNITVSNHGLDDLRIDGVMSACNCISWTRSAHQPIKSGSSQNLQLVYSSSIPGNKREEVTVYSNDISNSKIKFEVIAEVVENIEPKSLLKQNDVMKF